MQWYCNFYFNYLFFFILAQCRIFSREGNGTPLQYSCLENPMDGGAWWAAVHGVAKNQTWLRDFTFTLHFHALEKEMATHSSVLTWRIPGMREPDGLSSMGLHRVWHNGRDLAAAGASVLAWRIPGTGKPGGLPSMGSHRVWRDWRDLAAAAAAAELSQSGLWMYSNFIQK